MKVITIELPDSTDLTPFSIDAPTTVSQGAASAVGILRAKAEVSNPQLISHVHSGEVQVGPPEPPA